MIWLQGPQWIRWTLACLIFAGALWVELREQGSVQHPFATTWVEPGEPLTASNLEMRDVPNGVLDPVVGSGFATRAISPGEPLVPAAVSETPATVQVGWWSLELELPVGSNVGDEVQMILLDTGEIIPGIISAVPDEDVLGPGTGAVALPPESAAAAASAVASGRFAVLVSSG